MAPFPPTQRPDYDAFLSRGNDKRIIRYSNALFLHYRTVSTLGLPETAEPTDVPIQRLYVRPTIEWQEGTAEERQTLRDARIEVLAAQKQRVVLLGDAGTGKSTLVTWLTWTLSQRGRLPIHKQIGGMVPLTFVLRDLPVTERTTTWDNLVALLHGQPTWTEGLGEALPAMAEAGQLLVMLDGWDEIADTSLRSALRDAVLDGMARYPRCSFLLTSRPLGYDEVPLEAGAEELGLTRARIAPFDDTRIRAFIEAWYGFRAPDEAQDRTDELVAALRADPRLIELARTPYLLSMMALVHRRFGRLPAGRAELLARVTDAFLEGWEAAKGLPRPTTPLAVRRRWLQELALVMNRRRVWGASKADLAELEDERPDLVPDIDHAAPTPEHPDPASGATITRLQSGTTIDRDLATTLLLSRRRDGQPGESPTDVHAFLDWCVRRSGLLVPRSHGDLAFTHLTFQDWLAAGAFLERLRSGWLDPDRAERAARELERWILRAAGGQTVVMVLDVLRQEHPDMATELGDRVFHERAATYQQHARLAEAYREIVAARGQPAEGPEWFVEAGLPVDEWPESVLGMTFNGTVVGPVGQLRDVDGLDMPERLDATEAVYLIDCPDLTDLSPLLDAPAPDAPAPDASPVTRTVYIKKTGITAIPDGLPWRVVDEHGVVYTPEEGLERPPHTRP